MIKTSAQEALHSFMEKTAGPNPLRAYEAALARLKPGMVADRIPSPYGYRPQREWYSSGAQIAEEALEQNPRAAKLIREGHFGDEFMANPAMAEEMASEAVSRSSSKYDGGIDGWEYVKKLLSEGNY